MAKVSFASMKLKVDDTIKVVNINGKDIEVKQYLPIEDKNSLCEVALHAAAAGTVFNPLLAEAYFNTFVVIEYTNINFTDTQKADILKLYDILDSNDIINQVVETIPEREYRFLLDSFITMVNEITNYMTSAKAIADDLMQYAPDKSAQIAENVSNFDAEKYEEILRLAQATGLPLKEE